MQTLVSNAAKEKEYDSALDIAHTICTHKASSSLITLQFITLNSLETANSEWQMMLASWMVFAQIYSSPKISRFNIGLVAPVLGSLPGVNLSSPSHHLLSTTPCPAVRQICFP